MVFGCIWTLQLENAGNWGKLTQYQCVDFFGGDHTRSGNSSTSAGQSLALRGCQMLLQGHAVWMGTWVVVQMISTALKIVKAVAGHQHYTSIIILYLHIFASAQRVGSIVLLRLLDRSSGLKCFQKMQQPSVDLADARLAQVFAHAFSLQDPMETLSRFYKVLH